EVGPLKTGAAGSHYNGLRSAAAFNFAAAYAYVELTQAPNAAVAADAMLTLRPGANNYYPIYVQAGSPICQKKVGGVKTNLLAVPYDAVGHRFLRLRHDAASGNVVFEAAPGSSGAPGSWVALTSQAWNTAAVPLAAVLFELKAGTWQAESAAP